VTNLRMRLRKLEVQLTDHSGLIPHSPRWVAYWTERIRKLDSGQEGIRELIPFAAARAFLQAEDAHHAIQESGMQETTPQFEREDADRTISRR